MLRLAIILVAIAIGITLGITMANRYAKKKAEQQVEADSEYIEEASVTSAFRIILPLGVLFIVVFIGLLVLTNKEKADVSDRYYPAQFENGQIVPHHFGDKNSQ